MHSTRLNVEVVPTSAWATVRAPAAELDRFQSILGAWSARLVRSSSSGSGWQQEARPQAVWLRQGFEHLDVLLGALLAVGHQVEWELGLPSYADAKRYQAAVAARRALPVDSPRYLHDYQASAVLAALMAPWGRGILSAPTASGKTRMACAIAEAAGGSWVYLVPNQELARQTQAEAPSNLHCYSFGTALPGDLLQADGLIVDECHAVACRTRSVVLMRSRARWRIGMSGTALMRCDTKNALVIGLLGPVIFSIDIKELSAHNAIAKGTVRNILI